VIKALKVTMIVYAVIGILFGLAYIFIPGQLATMFGHDTLPELAGALAVALGASFVAACIFLIVAARDPLKHILWVKYAIVFAILMLAAELYSVIIGYLALGQAVTAIIIHGIIAVALLSFYPWRAA
jgi:hypothetical protein